MARLSTLTPQQVRVLMMLSEGLLNKQIAFELSVSEATVKAHVSAILQKLGVESRPQAVIPAAKIENGPPPPPASYAFPPPTSPSRPSSRPSSQAGRPCGARRTGAGRSTRCRSSW